MLLDDRLAKITRVVVTAVELFQDLVGLDKVGCALNSGDELLAKLVQDRVQVFDQALNRLLRVLKILAGRCDLNIAKLNTHIHASVDELADRGGAGEVRLERIEHKPHLEPAVAVSSENPVVSFNRAFFVIDLGVGFFLIGR